MNSFHTSTLGFSVSVSFLLSSVCGINDPIMTHNINNTSHTIEYNWRDASVSVENIENINIIDENDYISIFSNQLRTLMSFDESENSVIHFLTNNTNDLFFENAIINFFKTEDSFMCSQLLEIILSSDIDIFKKWYKNILLISMNSKSHILVECATDIFEYYKEDFLSV